MKHATKTLERLLTRREFVGGALTVAGAVAGAPALLRGRNLNGKLDIAFIACGGRGLSNLSELTITPGATPRRGRRRQSRRATGGAASGRERRRPLRRGPGCPGRRVQRFPKARTFNDLRRVFDNPSAFDAVVVSTADHTHAFATYLALTHGKHVYCEKPLTYNIWEARSSGRRPRSTRSSRRRWATRAMPRPPGAGSRKS